MNTPAILPCLEAILIDTETTRKSSDPEKGEPPIEVIELYWEDFAPTGTFVSANFQPRHPIQNGAVAVHGILPSDLVGCEPSEQASWRLPVAKYWIGHNVDFDWIALGSPPGVKRICTLALSRELWPDADSHSLGAMMYYLFGQTEKVRGWLDRAHEAAADVRLLGSLLQQIIRKRGEWKGLDELYVASEEARIPKVWGFGKFEGSPISAADRGYAGWFSRTCLDRPDYGYYMAALRRAGLVR